MNPDLIKAQRQQQAWDQMGKRPAVSRNPQPGQTYTQPPWKVALVAGFVLGAVLAFIACGWLS